jgi:hypothetical protein
MRKLAELLLLVSCRVMRCVSWSNPNADVDVPHDRARTCNVVLLPGTPSTVRLLSRSRRASRHETVGRPKDSKSFIAFVLSPSVLHSYLLQLESVITSHVARGRCNRRNFILRYSYVIDAMCC